MDEKIDRAIENVLAMIRPNVKPPEAQMLAQAALNLANTKHTLEGKPQTRKQGTGA